MGTRRCNWCKTDGDPIDWPNHEDYEICPICHRQTTCLNREPISDSEALHIRFDAFYAKRERDRLAAEKLEAHKFADEMAALMGPLTTPEDGSVWA